MHRQSLSSPNSKLHSPHKGLLTNPNNNNNIDLTTDTSHLAAGDDIDELRKSLKPQKSSEKLIHIIPMLIVFCFLVLYLSSHDPSQKEVSSFNGLKRNLKPIDIEISSEIDDFGGLMEEIGKSDVLAIRSMRNLQEIDKKQSQSNRVHRKIGDF